MKILFKHRKKFHNHIMRHGGKTQSTHTVLMNNHGLLVKLSKYATDPFPLSKHMNAVMYLTTHPSRNTHTHTSILLEPKFPTQKSSSWKGAEEKRKLGSDCTNLTRSGMALGLNNIAKGWFQIWCLVLTEVLLTPAENRDLNSVWSRPL